MKWAKSPKGNSIPKTISSAENTPVVLQIMLHAWLRSWHPLIQFGKFFAEGSLRRGMSEAMEVGDN